jgi:hypothetical protein
MPKSWLAHLPDMSNDVPQRPRILGGRLSTHEPHSEVEPLILVPMRRRGELLGSYTRPKEPRSFPLPSRASPECTSWRQTLRTSHGTAPSASAILKK